MTKVAFRPNMAEEVEQALLLADTEWLQAPPDITQRVPLCSLSDPPAAAQWPQNTVSLHERIWSHYSLPLNFQLNCNAVVVNAGSVLFHGLPTETNYLPGHLQIKHGPIAQSEAAGSSSRTVCAATAMKFLQKQLQGGDTELMVLRGTINSRTQCFFSPKALGFSHYQCAKLFLYYL